jgi:hypothetical protein
MLIGSRYAISNARDLPITLSGKFLKQSRFFKHLGVYIDHLLKWNKQVNYITGRVCHKLTMLNRVSKFLSTSILLRIYKQTILPIFDYGCVVWGGREGGGDCGRGNAKRLERLQNKAMRIILNANRKTCSQEMRIKLNLLSLESRRRFLRLQLVYKIVYNINCPRQLQGCLVRRSEMHSRFLRDNILLHVNYQNKNENGTIVV